MTLFFKMMLSLDFLCTYRSTFRLDHYKQKHKAVWKAAKIFIEVILTPKLKPKRGLQSAEREILDLTQKCGIIFRGIIR